MPKNSSNEHFNNIVPNKAWLLQEWDRYDRDINLKSVSLVEQKQDKNYKIQLWNILSKKYW